MSCPRGFTAFELALGLSISAILVPSIYLLGREMQNTERVTRWHLETAAAIERVDAELQSDVERQPLEAGKTVEWPGPCPVRYTVTEGQTLERQAGEGCGGTRVLATGVQSFSRVPEGVELVFALRLAETATRQTKVFLPLEAR